MIMFKEIDSNRFDRIFFSSKYKAVFVPGNTGDVLALQDEAGLLYAFYEHDKTGDSKYWKCRFYERVLNYV